MSWHQPAVEAETQRSGISLSLCLCLSLSLSLRELRRVRWRPLPTSPTSPWALLSLAAPGALRAWVQCPTHPNTPHRPRAHARPRRGLGLASGVLSEGPALPPCSDPAAAVPSPPFWTCLQLLSPSPPPLPLSLEAASLPWKHCSGPDGHRRTGLQAQGSAWASCSGQGLTTSCKDKAMASPHACALPLQPAQV